MAADDDCTHDGGCCCNRAHLTKGEISILTAIATGDTSQKAAALTLGIKPDTVNEHIGNMNAKAGIRKRAELITMVIIQGILVIEDGAAPNRTSARHHPNPAEHPVTSPHHPT